MEAVITGANRGLGLAMAEGLLARGAAVHATARRPEAAGALRALAKRHPGRLRVHRLDVTDDAQCEALGAALGSGPLDLLVNNAGIDSGFIPFTEAEPGPTLRVFDVNAVGPLRVTRALLPALERQAHERQAHERQAHERQAHERRAHERQAHERQAHERQDHERQAHERQAHERQAHERQAHERQGGVVLNVSSRLASIANDDGLSLPYRMSKAALNMMTHCLAMELRARGVAVVAVSPGWVRTDMGGPDAPLSVADSSARLVALALRLSLGDTGAFLDLDGRPIPW